MPATLTAWRQHHALRPAETRGCPFINVADNAFLDHGQRDFGYAVFGKVVKGMDVADKISQVPTHDVGPYQNVPSKPVVILSAKVLP